jgi:hypothetical protein
MALERQIVRIGGDDEGLVALLTEPLRQALSGRRAYYSVNVEAVGRVGEVMVRIDGAKGRLPLLLRAEDIHASCVASVVRDTVHRYDF